MNETMTEQDVAAATRQGWRLDLVYDTRGYTAYAVVPSDRSSLKTPYEAMKFVWGRAKKHDAVCQRALSLVHSAELAGKSSVRKPRKPNK